MTTSSKQVKVAWGDLMTALGAWLRDVGAFAGYIVAYIGFVIGRNYAKATRMKHADMLERFPKPKRPSAKAAAPQPMKGEPTLTQSAPAPQPLRRETSKSTATKPEQMKSEQSTTQNKPTPMAAESSASKVSAKKEPPAVPKPVPKKRPTVNTADSVVPPNIERAVKAQLRASGKDSMGGDEMLSLMTALGVGPTEAKSTLQLLKTQNKRDTVVEGDLAQVQAWITKGWILGKRRVYRHFEITVREQFGLELNAPLAREVLSAELVKRGFTEASAGDVASKLISRDWLNG